MTDQSHGPIGVSADRALRMTDPHADPERVPQPQVGIDRQQNLVVVDLSRGGDTIKLLPLNAVYFAGSLMRACFDLGMPEWQLDVWTAPLSPPQAAPAAIDQAGVVVELSEGRVVLHLTSELRILSLQPGIALDCATHIIMNAWMAINGPIELDLDRDDDDQLIEQGPKPELDQW